MPKKVQEREGFVEVTTTVVGKRKRKAKKLKIRPFVTSPANVSVKMGLTIPTGDWSSARVDVMLSVPCYVEEMLQVYEDVRDLVDQLIEGEVSRLTEE